MKTKNNKIEVIKSLVEDIAKNADTTLTTQENIDLKVTITDADDKKKDKLPLNWDQLVLAWDGQKVKIDFFMKETWYWLHITSAEFPDDPQKIKTKDFNKVLEFVTDNLTPTFTGDAS